MPKYNVTGFWTYKANLEIEADSESIALEIALQSMPNLDNAEITETYIESAELLP